LLTVAALVAKGIVEVAVTNLVDFADIVDAGCKVRETFAVFSILVFSPNTVVFIEAVINVKLGFVIVVLVDLFVDIVGFILDVASSV